MFKNKPVFIAINNESTNGHEPNVNKPLYGNQTICFKQKLWIQDKFAYYSVPMDWKGKLKIYLCLIT